MHAERSRICPLQDYPCIGMDGKASSFLLTQSRAETGICALLIQSQENKEYLSMSAF